MEEVTHPWANKPNFCLTSAISVTGLSFLSKEKNEKSSHQNQIKLYEIKRFVLLCVFCTTAEIFSQFHHC
jgi:hypothetical protein